jgi:hypothetical protein
MFIRKFVAQVANIGERVYIGELRAGRQADQLFDSMSSSVAVKGGGGGGMQQPPT